MNALQEQLSNILVDNFGAPSELLTDEITLEELGFDSLAVVELALVVKRTFGVTVVSDEITPEHTFVATVRLLENKGVNV